MSDLSRCEIKVLAYLRNHPDDEFGGTDLMVATGVSSGLLTAALVSLVRDGSVARKWGRQGSGLLGQGPGQPRVFYRLSKALPDTARGSALGNASALSD